MLIPWQIYFNKHILKNRERRKEKINENPTPWEP
jgi:hypothetical protein